MFNHNTHSRTVEFYPISAPTTSDQEAMVLGDNLRVHPDILIGNGNGIFISGVQGSGKTGIFARVLEQAARFHVPMVVFDMEGDITPTVQLFPRGIIATRTNCPSARDVLKGGLQVVYDLSSWHSMDEKGSFIARLVNGLFQVSDTRAIEQRTPCLIGLDEAALFVPQKRGDTFSTEIYRGMHDAFHLIATMGRKRGLTPVLCSQKLSEVAKTVLSPGTYIMLRQVVHTDLKRYLDYIERSDIFQYMSERQICQFVSSLQPGRAIVKLANGEQKIVQFYERDSVHISHTPRVQAAFNLYGSQPFNANVRYGADIDGIDQEPTKPLTKKERTTQKAPDKRVAKKDTRPRCEFCKKLATHKTTHRELQKRTSGHVSVKSNYTYQCATHAHKDSTLL